METPASAEDVPGQSADAPATQPEGGSALLDLEEQRSLARVRRGLFGAAVAEPLKINRYALLHPVGAGAMGIVYAAQDPELGRQVAIKLLQARRDGSDGASNSLLREAQAMAKLSHPNVIAVHDVGTYELPRSPAAALVVSKQPHLEGVYVVMELLEGVELGEWLRRSPRRWTEIVDVFAAAGRGLAAAHEVGLVHRDFKPANVIVTTAGTVKVLDFGLVRGFVASPMDDDEAAAQPAEAGANATRTGRAAGTPRYMAPEQFDAASMDGRTDQFAFCVALYEALWTRLPFADLPLSVSRRARAQGDIRPPPTTGDVPAWLFDVVRRGLSPRPQDRFATMTDLLAAVEGRRRRLGRVRVGAALAVALLGAVGVGVWVGAERTAPAVDVVAAAPSVAPVAEPSTPPTVLAVLPVVDRTADGRANGMRDALAHVIARELGRVPQATLVDYFALSRIVEPSSDTMAPAPVWERAALGLGATVTVHAFIDDAGPVVSLMVELHSPTGEVLHGAQRRATPDGVGDAARAVARTLATQLGAPPTAVTTGPDRRWDYERELSEGLAELERGHFDTAAQALQAAVALRPDDPEAHFHLALARSWIGQTDGALAEIEHALASDPSPRQRSFLEAYGAHVAGRNAEAIAAFREAAASHPGDRYIDYGLFESLFHGGYPGDGIAVYRAHLGAVSPFISLALMHVLEHYAARGDREGLSWALTLTKGVDESFASSWRVGDAVFERDYERALLEVARLQGSAAQNADLLLIELNALAGRPGLAKTLAEQLEATAPTRATIPLLALHTLLRSGKRERYRVEAIATASLMPRAFDRVKALTEVALLELPSADRRLPELRRTLHDAADEYGTPEARATTVLALLAGRPYDEGEVQAARASEFPQAQAIGEAYAAEHAGEFHGALPHWDAALASEMDGRFVIALWWSKARAAANAGATEALAAACREVLMPRSFRWTWAVASGVPPCDAQRSPSPE